MTVTSKQKDISNYLGMSFLRIMEIIKKVILPVGLVGLLLLMFYPVCSADGTTDYFMLWILVGFPFGVRRNVSVAHFEKLWIVLKSCK